MSSLHHFHGYKSSKLGQDIASLVNNRFNSPLQYLHLIFFTTCWPRVSIQSNSIMHSLILYIAAALCASTVVNAHGKIAVAVRLPLQNAISIVI